MTGLPHPTVLRLLRHLTGLGMVAWDPATKIYRLGTLTFELGLAAAEHCDIRGLCGDSLDRLQAETQDTCYLTMRSGFDAVCIDRREGASPIRVLTLDIGSRRPLGVGAAGLAILDCLPEEEAETVIQASESKLDAVQPHEHRHHAHAAAGNARARLRGVRQLGDAGRDGGCRADLHRGRTADRIAQRVRREPQNARRQMARHRACAARGNA